MAQKTLEETFHATRETDFDQNFWNKFVGDIGARLRALDKIKIDWEEVSQEGIQVALDRINSVLGPAAERVQNIAALGFLSVESVSSKTLALGTVNFVAVQGDQLDLFVPTPFVAITRKSTPLDYAIGQVTFFDRETGSMDISISFIQGNAGPHNDWTISAVAGQAIAQSSILNITVTAKDLAVTAQGLADTARVAAVAAKGDAEAARTASVAAKDTAIAARADAVTAKAGAEGFATTAGQWSAKAQDWAVKMDGLVDGDYSAKYWANQAFLNGGVPIGTVIDVFGNGATTPAGYLKVVPGLEITAAYPTLRAWAIANGWAVNGSGNPVFPSTDDALFKRQWRAGQTLRDAGRAFGTVQADDIKSHTHTEFKEANIGGTAGRPASGGPFGSNPGDTSATGGLETRPANITVTWFIKAYSASLDAATVAAAQVLADLAEARARVASLEAEKGKRVLIQEIVISSVVSAVDFVDKLSNTYDEYVMEWFGVTCSASASLYLQAALSGSTFLTSGYRLGYVSTTSSAVAGQETNSATFIYLVPNSLAPTSSANEGTTTIKRTPAGMLLHTNYSMYDGASFRSGQASGMYPGAIGSLRIVMSTGTINAGTFRLYGRKK
jgi:hypothetical protein